MPEFNNWFPTSLYGDDALNVMSFGAYGDVLAHSMNDLGFANIDDAHNGVGGNGKAYPAAIDMNDTADWCAITECLKHAYKHETSPGVWVSNGTDGWRNRPVVFPKGQYLTRRPVVFRDVTQATIRGTGYVQIYNENITPPDNVGVIMDGMQSCRVENIDMQSAGGVGCQGLRLDAFGASHVNTTGVIFYNCNFVGPGGVGCHIGQSQMSSEMTFIKCNASYSEYGFVIDNWNALNYQFLACGGISNAKQWLRVNTGGCIVVQNASLADNGTADLYEGFDILNGAGAIVVLATRTESRRFLSGMNVTAIGCTHATSGADTVFCNAGPANIINCQSTMARICGPGPVKVDESSVFCQSKFYVYNITSGTGGRVKITHDASTAAVTAGFEVFYDGDEVVVENVASTNTTSAGGAAHTNGTWTIAKLNATQVELIGSTFVADTYNYTDARIGGSPRFHLREIIYPPGNVTPSKLVVTAVAAREPWETKTKDFDILLADSGSTFDNRGATGPVVFTLPFTQKPEWTNVRGSRFFFTVFEPQTFTIRVNVETITSPSTRIFRAGGFATAGLTVSSNVIGNTIELILMDGPTNIQTDPALLPWRWLIRSETGTWAISGTPP